MEQDMVFISPEERTLLLRVLERAPTHGFEDRDVVRTLIGALNRLDRRNDVTMTLTL